jgi:class 3 adenylate cyclase
MIDRANRPSPRFPIGVEGEARERLRENLKGVERPVGFASAACGGDLLFHELVQESQGESHIVLPCPIAEFRAACVDPFPGDWGPRFERVIERAASLDILSDQCANDNSVASDCCNRVIYGLAALRAKESDLPLAVLALWDGQRGDAVGGTHSMVMLCREREADIRLLGDVLPPSDQPLPVPPGACSGTQLPGAETDPPQRIAAALFADVVRYSTISERNLPAFAEHYLGGVQKLVEKYAEDVLTQNTWGDALYVAFGSTRTAGRFALDLRDFVNATDWKGLGFPADLQVRVGLHTGPVYRIYDPIFDGVTYIGTHVTRAVRIEPQADQGAGPSCSRAFAALRPVRG